MEAGNESEGEVKEERLRERVREGARKREREMYLAAKERTK